MFKKAGIMLAAILITASFVYAQIGVGTSQATKAVSSTVTTTAKVDALSAEDNVKKEMPKAPADFKADFVGHVVSIEKLLLDGSGKIDSKTAEKIMVYGKPIAFFSKGNVYIVYTAGGNYAGKKLAALADAPKVGIAGSVKTIKGLKYIIANGIYAF